MQFRYVNDKRIMILTEDGLEEWFWEQMYKALVAGDVKFKKSHRTSYEGEDKNISNYTVIEIAREN